MSNNQPISLTKEQVSVVSDHVCVFFLCPWKWIFHLLALLAKQRWGGGLLGCGSSYWLATCVLWWWVVTPAILRLFDPGSSHTFTVCSTQQRGCENTMPDICFPPGDWNRFSMSQQEAELNILMECEFDRAHILVWKHSFALCRISRESKSSSLKKRTKPVSFHMFLDQVKELIIHSFILFILLIHIIKHTLCF